MNDLRLPFLLALGSFVACGGSTDGSGNQGLSGTGGTPAAGGANASGGTNASGGANASGGTNASGGGTGGSAAGAAGAINCSNVGCAPPPGCDTGCTEPCGCCPCTDGTVQGTRVCTGGCYALMDGGTTTCLYSGVTYAVGASYPAGDGCNTCTCLATGASTCTLRPCAAGGGTP